MKNGEPAKGDVKIRRVSQTPRALYPGTFDPITLGHLDLIRRGVDLFGSLCVAVARNDSKTPLFSVEERLDMIRAETRELPGVSVESFGGLVVEYCRLRGIPTILRGVRTASDFEYEFRMALTNRVLNEGVETVFVMPNESYAYLSSSLIKEVYSSGGDLTRFLTPSVHERLLRRLRRP
ncbi:MAG: pantetheine-phosphate adenylyltransferase [Planctomycetota bacterium]|nr:MAG: pantetheine-phosphate adenylyltransferase [Planctomycetota bacterium]